MGRNPNAPSQAPRHAPHVARRSRDDDMHALEEGHAGAERKSRSRKHGKRRAPTLHPDAAYRVSRTIRRKIGTLVCVSVLLSVLLSVLVSVFVNAVVSE